eukprot:4367974-Amphidinium_carterae.1
MTSLAVRFASKHGIQRFGESVKSSGCVDIAGLAHLLVRMQFASLSPVRSAKALFCNHFVFT